jgi:hypothetical protein
MNLTHHEPSYVGSAVRHQEKAAERWLEERIKKSRSGIISEVVELTPDLARALLARNQANRPLNHARVSTYAEDIKSGWWEFNGETMIVSSDGFLNDGQNRCAGVIKAGQSITTVIVFGVSRESRMTVDQGLARTIGHYLGMDGIPYSNQAAHVALCIWQFQKYRRLSRESEHRPSKSAIVEFYHKTPGISESISKIPARNSLNIGGRSLLAFCHWMIKNVANEFAADSFFEKLIDGTNLDHDSPILYARNKLLDKKNRYQPNERAELIFRAWNAVRTNKSPKSMQIRNEELPTIHP